LLILHSPRVVLLIYIRLLWKARPPVLESCADPAI
jgi:hypothetical protein